MFLIAQRHMIACVIEGYKRQQRWRKTTDKMKKNNQTLNNSKPMACDTLLGCVIFRIDGNKCFSEPIKGLMGHYKTKEGAEKYLQERGFYLETRKWQNIGGHEEGTENKKWYNKKLSDDGYSYDNTFYAFITKVEVRA